MTTQDVQPDPLARGNQLAFHVCLPLICLVGLSWLIAGGLAVWAFTRASTRRARFWARMLAGLAVADLLWVVLVFLIGTDRIPVREMSGLPPLRVQIGVILEQESEYGVSIREVRPGLPAEAAGLEGGDHIVAVDGHQIDGLAEFRTALNRCADGETLELEADRDGELLFFTVAPEPVDAADSPERTELFEPTEAREEAVLKSVLDDFLHGLPALSVLALAWLFARSRGGRSTEFAGWVLVIFGSWYCSSLIVTILGILVFGGYTIAGYLMVLSSVCLALGTAGAVAAWKMRDTWPDGVRRGGEVAKVIGLGVLYMVCGAPRVGVFALALDSLTGQAVSYSNPVAATFTVGLPAGALAVLTVTAALVGPVAEELVYRGFLLPWFASALGRTWALVITSVSFGLIHYHYGVFLLIPILYGFVLGWARLRSGGLLAPITLHVGINLVMSCRQLL